MPEKKLNYKYPGKRIFIRTGILVAVIVMVVFLFRYAGYYLVIKNGPVHADAIVVLMGSVGDRAFEAYDLFSQGYSNRILLAEDHEVGRQELRNRGIYLSNDAEKVRDLLIALGVPDSLVVIIPGDNQSTREEAKQVGEYIQKYPQMDTLLLVTSASHSRRAILYFKNVLDDLSHPVKIISCPSRHSEFQAGQWWADRGSAKQIAYEYSRLIYFYIWDQF